MPHGFLGRAGGVSTGILAGLNVGLGSNDDRAAIHENRRRAVAAVLPGAALATLHQVHSADAVIVTEPFADDARPPADALVTDRPGLLLGILTADCAPVLLADAQAGVVGAAHAGWMASRAASRKPIPPMSASSSPAGPAISNSTSRPMSPPGLRPPASAGSRRSVSIPTPMRRPSSASAARRIAANRIMGARFR
jgi:hypothetical protein